MQVLNTYFVQKAVSVLYKKMNVWISDYKAFSNSSDHCCTQKPDRKIFREKHDKFFMIGY